MVGYRVHAQSCHTQMCAGKDFAKIHALTDKDAARRRVSVCRSAWRLEHPHARQEHAQVQVCTMLVLAPVDEAAVRRLLPSPCEP